MCVEAAHDGDNGGGGEKKRKTSAFQQSSSWQGMYESWNTVSLS